MARVLIVEDQKKLLQSLRRGLEEEGYDVITAANGEEGYYLATTGVARCDRPRPDAARAGWTESPPRPAQPGLCEAGADPDRQRRSRGSRRRA